MGVKVDCSELKAFAERIGKLNAEQREAFFPEAARALAGHMLDALDHLTPVGDGLKDAEGKTIRQGGTLRRGWTSSTENAARSGGGKDVAAYAQSRNVECTARKYYRITLTNPVKYASYVEYGHRQTPGRYVPAIGKRLKVAWVEGKFFLRRSEDDLRAAAPGIMKPMLDEFLKRVF